MSAYLEREKGTIMVRTHDHSLMLVFCTGPVNFQIFNQTMLGMSSWFHPTTVECCCFDQLNTEISETCKTGVSSRNTIVRLYLQSTIMGSYLLLLILLDFCRLNFELLPTIISYDKPWLVPSSDWLWIFPHL